MDRFRFKLGDEVYTISRHERTLREYEDCGNCDNERKVDYIKKDGEEIRIACPVCKDRSYKTTYVWEVDKIDPMVIKSIITSHDNVHYSSRALHRHWHYLGIGRYADERDCFLTKEAAEAAVRSRNNGNI